MGVGDKVVAIGNPRGLEGAVPEGIVGAIRGTAEGVQVLQITAPISPGSSGGPLFSAAGEVVGVTTATLRDSQSLNFAVPAALLLTLRDKGREWEPVVGRDMPAPRRVVLVDSHATYQGRLRRCFLFALNNNKRAIQTCHTSSSSETGKLERLFTLSRGPHRNFTTRSGETICGY